MWWNAETAHDWLLGRFIPKVLDTEFDDRLREFKRRWWQPASLRGPTPRPVPLEGLASSAAVAAMPSASLPANDIRALEASVAALQRFFHVPRSLQSVPASHFRAVLLVASRCLRQSRPLDEHYVRSNLYLHEDATADQGLQRRIREDRSSAGWFEMDLALRALLIIVENMAHAEPGGLMYAAQQLQPLWDMHQDHELLRHWRSRP